MNLTLVRPRRHAAAARLRPRLGRVHGAHRLGRRAPSSSAPQRRVLCRTTRPARSTSHAYVDFATAAWRGRADAEARRAQRFMREVIAPALHAPRARTGARAPARRRPGRRSSPPPTSSSPRRSPRAFGVDDLIAVELERDAGGRITGRIARRAVVPRRQGRARRAVAGRARAGLARTSSASPSTATPSTTCRCSNGRRIRWPPTRRPRSRPSPASAAGAS